MLTLEGFYNGLQTPTYQITDLSDLPEAMQSVMQELREMQEDLGANPAADIHAASYRPTHESSDGVAQ